METERIEPLGQSSGVGIATERGPGYRTARPRAREPECASQKRLLLTALKCVASGALIYWLLHDTNAGDIFRAVRSAKMPLLLLAFSLHAIGYFVIAHRWRVLLKVQGIDASISFLIKSSMMALFFSNFMPSIIGGDVVRAYDSWRLGKNKAGAMAVIFVDRFLGVLVLLLFACSALLVSKQLAMQLPCLYVWILLGLAGILLIVWSIFIPSRQVATLITKVRLPFTRKLQGILNKIIEAFLPFHGRKTVLGKALGLSLILQVNVITHYYLIAKALSLPVSFGNFFLIVPLAIFVMMIPVSINAIGIRENIFAFFFAAFGVTKPEAVAFAWLVYGMVLLQGVLGGIVYALRR